MVIIVHAILFLSYSFSFSYEYAVDFSSDCTMCCIGLQQTEWRSRYENPADSYLKADIKEIDSKNVTFLTKYFLLWKIVIFHEEYIIC